MRKLLPYLMLFPLLISNILVAEQTNPTKSQAINLKVAVVLGLTGFAAEHSNSILRGILLAQKDLAKKNIHIDLKVEDDQTDPKKTALSFNYLASQGYQYIIGPTWSFQVQPALPIIDRNNLIAIMPAGSSEINGGSHSNIFNLCRSRLDQVDPISEKITELLKTKTIKPMIITPEGDWGEIHAEVFKKALAKAGISEIHQETFDYTLNFNDAKTLILKAKQKGINLILTTGAGANVADFYKANLQLALNADLLTTQDFLDAINSQLIVKPKTFANSRVFISRYQKPNTDFMSRFDPKDPPIFIHAARGYDALLVLTDAIQKSSNNVNQIKNYLSKQSKVQGVTGEISFDKLGNSSAGEYEVVEFNWDQLK